jgi:acyl transferase domain-containing protein
VEAHGTGTRLGDPVEIAALTDVFRRHTDRTGYCSLGSVKANVGHLRCGAGVASLIKACLVLSHRTLPPLANFERANPRIDFERSPFHVHTDARPWRAGTTPRRAAVSSFGFGGANVHVVLEEHLPVPSRPSARRTHLLVVSARTEAALARQVAELGAHLDEHPALPAADVAHTLQRGRREFSHRACFLADGERIPPRTLDVRRPLASGVAPARAASPVFLFPGQGAQRVGAAPLPRARALFGTGRRVRGSARAGRISTFVRCWMSRDRTARTLPRSCAAPPTPNRRCSWSGTRPRASNICEARSHAQTFAGELVRLSRTSFRSPTAGWLRPCPLVGVRGGIQRQSSCRKVSRSRLTPSEIAAVNAPSISVVSGPTEVVERFCAALDAEGVGTQPIDTSHAFHSRMIEPALPEFARVLAGVALAPPKVPVISNATGRPLSDGQATDPRYWADHIRHPVASRPGSSICSRSPTRPSSRSVPVRR